MCVQGFIQGGCLHTRINLGAVIFSGKGMPPQLPYTSYSICFTCFDLLYHKSLHPQQKILYETLVVYLGICVIITCFQWTQSLSVQCLLLFRPPSNHTLHPGWNSPVSVGFIGYPNVGKSSIINTLRSKKVCSVAPLAGETKVRNYSW